MLKRIILLILSFAILAPCPACFKEAVPPPATQPPEPQQKAGKGKAYDERHITEVITTDTVWEGKVAVDGVIKVAKGARLTIRPGTTVEFTYNDYDEDGLGDSGLLVEGGIFAMGSYDAPIHFTAANGSERSGAWGMILVNFSNEVIFDYCKFEYSSYTLHIHFSTGSITNSLFTNNEDGTRIGRSKFLIYNNVFKGNAVKGLNFTDSKNEIKYNTITGNKHGIFLFEGDKNSDISHNNILDNKLYNFKLGDFFIGDVTLYDNYWGATSDAKIRGKIFDKRSDDTLGVVKTTPAKERFADTGIIKEINITKVFEFEAAGYIDSSAAIDEETSTVYFGSFDGRLYALDAVTGELKFKFDAGDVIDSTPVVYKDSVYFASWNNKLYCLNKSNGRLKWEYQMQSSEQDDHRQSSPVAKDDVIYIGGYDGSVYALDYASGVIIWKFKTGGAIRSKGVVDGKAIVFASSDGTLYWLSLKSGRGMWMVNLGSPALATPLVFGDTIFASTKDGVLYGIDAKTKTVSGRFMNNSVNFYSSPISFKGDVVFATTDGNMYRLGKYNLAAKAVADINGPAYATPLAYEDFLLAPTNNGELNIIERGAAMRTVKKFTGGGAIQSTPVAYDGKLYFGARDNKFYAIKIDVVTTDGFTKNNELSAQSPSPR